MSTRTMQYQDAVESFRVLAEDAANLALRGTADDDWMVAANAESALALRELAAGAADELQHLQRSTPSIDDLKAPLLAAVGAADLALERVSEITATLRGRAGETRADAEARLAESRARIARLQEELTSDELRKFIETYAKAAQTTYNTLVERGQAALERLRDTPAIQTGRVGDVEWRSRAVGERAAKLVGVELPSKKAPAKKAPAKKAQAKTPAKKAPAKKAPAKKVARRK